MQEKLTKKTELTSVSCKYWYFYTNILSLNASRCFLTLTQMFRWKDRLCRDTLWPCYLLSGLFGEPRTLSRLCFRLFVHESL